MLQKISMFDYSKGIGIKAYTDGYSYDHYGYVHFISILGQDSSVKGLSSAIVLMRDVTIDIDDENELTIGAMPREKYRILSARLDSGLLHQIVVMDAILNKNSNNNTVYIGDKSETSNVIFGMHRKSFGTPLLPEWKSWVIRQMQNEEMFKLLEGNISLAKINLKERQLDSIISDGIKTKSISF